MLRVVGYPVPKHRARDGPGEMDKRKYTVISSKLRRSQIDAVVFAALSSHIVYVVGRSGYYSSSR